MLQDKRQIFVAKIGSKNNTKYMFCELSYDLITNSHNLTNIVDLLNSIHKASKIDSDFTILFICYKDQQGNQENGISRLVYTKATQTTTSETSDEQKNKRIKEEWSTMLEYLNDMSHETTVYMINLETSQYQLKIISEEFIPKKAQTQLLTWLQQSNNLTVLNHQLQQKK